METGEAMAPLLSVEEVRKEFDVRGARLTALDSVSLSVQEREFVTVIGPSGCGKSTLLNVIVGLAAPSAGRVVFRGRPVTGITPAIGYVTQRDNLLPWRTLIENVEIALEIRGVAGGAPRAFSPGSASRASNPITRMNCRAACGSGPTSSARSSTIRN
jgi:NitT/TauT family transport system ATP-binding protein